MQIRNSFDPVTLGKIKRSALISLGGFAVSAIPLVMPAVLESLSKYPVAALFAGSMATLAVNAVREFLKGEDSKLTDGAHTPD